MNPRIITKFLKGTRRLAVFISLCSAATRSIAGPLPDPNGHTCSTGKCYPVLMQTKSAWTNGAKCGFEEFEHHDLPWIHMYLHELSVLSASTSTNYSGTNSGTGGCDELDCNCTAHADPGPNSSSSSDSIGITFDDTYSPGISCDHTNFWSGQSTHNSTDEDGRDWIWSCDDCTGVSHNYYSYGTDHLVRWPNLTTNGWRIASSEDKYGAYCWTTNCQWPNGCGTNSSSTSTDGYCAGGEGCHELNWADWKSGWGSWGLSSRNSTQYVETNAPPTGTFTATLENEYTDSTLHDVLNAAMPPYPTDWYDGSDIAFSQINDTHVGDCGYPCAELYKVKYRLGVHAGLNHDPRKHYTISWNEYQLFVPDGEWNVFPHSEDVSGPDEYLWTKGNYEMNPPFNSHNEACEFLYVFQFVADDTVTVCDGNDVAGTGGLTSSDPGGCASCGSNGTRTSGAVNAQFSLGQTLLATPLPKLNLSAALPSLALATPAGLVFPDADAATQVITNADRSLRQISAPQTLLDIVTNTQFSYDLRFYLPSDAGTFTNGLYHPTGSPFVTWRVENPDASTNDFHRLRLTEIRGSTGFTNEIAYTNSLGGWTLTGPAGLSQNQTTAGLADYSAGSHSSVFSMTNVIRPLGGSPATKVARKYQQYSHGLRLIEETLNPDSDPKTTTSSYYDLGNTLYGPPLKRVIRPDGSWTWYNPDDYGRPAAVFNSFADSPAPGLSETLPGGDIRRTDYSYGGAIYLEGDDGSVSTNTPRSVVEYTAGAESSRRWTILPTNASGFLRIDVQAGVPGLSSAYWAYPLNLFTTNQYYSSGPNQGRLKSIVHPDGTFTTYDYTNDPSGLYLTNVTASGQPNSTFTAVTDGTTNWSVVNLGGYPVLSVTKDIASGIITAQETYSNFDNFGRPGRVTHLDGTYEDTTYACCGVDTTIDRDGVTTQYLRDAAKRLTAQTRRGITTTNALDAAGHTLKTIRIGTDNSQIVQSQSGYNLAGDLIKQTNALNGVTSYSEGKDPDTGGLIRTNIFPDGGTRIEFYYLDGQLKKVAGTAAAPMLYFYGIEHYGATEDNSRPYTLEIKLSDTGGTNEWTKTYTDILGRAYKTIYSDSTPDDLTDNPSDQSWYNNKGQLWKQRDPDGVTTLYAYNAKGEQAYTITAIDDSTRNTSSYDSLLGSLSSLSSLPSGNDRITFVTNDVIHDSVLGADVRRTRTYVWTNNGSSGSLLTSTTETSTDGLHTWQISFGLTNESITAYASGGWRYSTNFAPDRSCTVSISRYGTNVSSARFDSLNNQLSSIKFGYDSHGRQNVAVDARSGGTTNWFNAMDQISSTKTPVPATGQSAQVTTNFFDTSGRVTATKLPDNTFVTNKFNLMGLLTNTFGSRTYPVSYSYDVQGRMKAMKTYKSFAANSGVATTTWNYDQYRGWLSSKLYDDGHGPSYDYFPSGRLKTRVWARGVGTTNSYNAAGDLEAVNYSDSTIGCTNSFDRRGRKVTTLNGATTTTLGYNDAGQPLTESYSSGTLGGLGITNTYDAVLRRTNATAAASTAYGYDKASRLQTVADAAATITYSYLTNSPLVSGVSYSTLGTPEMSVTRTYDLLNRAVSAVSSPAAAPPTSFAYGYNSANQRTSITNTDNSRWSFGYDSLGQVNSGKRYWLGNLPVAGQQFEYSFDEIGNRTSTRRGGDQYNGSYLRAANYSANNLNQYSSRDVPGYLDIFGSAKTNATVSLWTADGYWAETSRHGDWYRGELALNNSTGALWLTITNLAVLQNGTNADIATNVTGNAFVPKTVESLTYDLDGNLTSDGRWTNHWDAENRLISMESLTNGPSGSKLRLTFGYDDRSRRISKQVESWTGSNWVTTVSNKFVYDGWNLVSLLNGTNNALLQSYTWGLDLSGTEQGAGGIGGLLILRDATHGRHFPVFDANGNLTALTDASSGTNSATFEYGPFGEPLRASGPMAFLNPFRFSNKFQDDETGLLYYGYRSYNPSTGRWLNRDPLNENGGLSLYNLANNRPSELVDVLGLWGTSAHHDLVDLWLKKRPPPEGQKWSEYSWRCVEINVPFWLDEGSDQVDGVASGDLGDFCDAQSSEGSYRHEMRAWYETAASAKSKYNAFITHEIAQAFFYRAQAEAASDYEMKRTMINNAVRCLGRAGHAVEDSTSPAHDGFQLWFGIDDGIFILGPVGYAIFVADHHRRENDAVYVNNSESAAQTVASKMHPYLKNLLRE
jgi:RHS repeat-associated protein